MWSGSNRCSCKRPSGSGDKRLRLQLGFLFYCTDVSLGLLLRHPTFAQAHVKQRKHTENYQQCEQQPNPPWQTAAGATLPTVASSAGAAVAAAAVTTIVCTTTTASVNATINWCYGNGSCCGGSRGIPCGCWRRWQRHRLIRWCHGGCQRRRHS